MSLSNSPIFFSGQVVYQNRISASLRKHKGTKRLPGSFFNSQPFLEGTERPPLAVAVSDRRLQQIEAFLSHFCSNPCHRVVIQLP